MLEEEKEILYLAKLLHESNRILVEGDPDKMIQPSTKGSFKEWDELTDDQRAGKILVAKSFLMYAVVFSRPAWEIFKKKDIDVANRIKNTSMLIADLSNSLNSVKTVFKKIVEKYPIKPNHAWMLPTSFFKPE